MKKIEYSISTIKSLHAISLAGSEEEIVEIDDEDETQLDESDIAETVMSTSDEDFEKLSPEDFEEALSDGKDLGDGDEEESEEEVNEEEEPTSAEEGETEQTETEDETAGDQPIDNSEDTAPYEETYKQLFGEPIRASGREVKLRDANHARNLIEMGVDYNKKMQNMRPHMQTLKTLEKEGLLGDTEQLNLLLEARQGNPDAIKKLISQANIDVLDIADDDENAGSYTPGNHMVSEQEVAVGEALSAIKQSPKYNDTIDVMQNVFDQKSREIISDNPEYIASLNSDIERGVYDQVMEAVQYKKDIRAVPTGMSDIELYIATVQEMSRNQHQSETTAAPTAQPEPTQINRRSTGASRKRKAAMSGSRVARKKKEPNFDPMDTLSMADDAFEKQFGDQLL